jgi:transcriptional regulator with XRE-family HTH domain
MDALGPGQIKAARALLDWSQEQLAASSALSVATIRNIEQGNGPRHATLALVRAALERAGIEFLDRDGVRRRADEVTVLQGPQACERFCADLFAAPDPDLVAISKSQEMLAASLGLPGDARGAENLAALAHAKALVSELPHPALVMPGFELRTIPTFRLGPTSYFVYRDRYVVTVTDDNRSFRYIMFKSPALAHAYRGEFRLLWDMAFPLAPETASRLAARR